MKIFMMTEFVGGISIKIVKDNDDNWIVLHGERCKERMSIYGCELNKDEESRLIKWLNELSQELHLEKMKEEIEK